jgi:hypothetical protein
MLGEMIRGRSLAFKAKRMLCPMLARQSEDRAASLLKQRETMVVLR